jgi:hypothetical protein
LKRLPPGAADQALIALREEATLAATDREAIQQLAERLGQVRTILLPELASDVHDLGSLSALNVYFLEGAT